MNDSPEVTRAIELMRDQLCTGPASCTRAARMLSSAGLLRTDLHERALAACEAYSRVYNGTSKYSEGHVVATVGHESIASRRPKERWQVFGRMVRLVAVPRVPDIPCLDGADAERVASLLNAEEGK